MVRDHLEAFISGSHGLEDFLERMERTLLRLVNVGLVHLISQEDDTVLLAKVDDLAHVLLAQALSSRVAGVDDHKSASVDTLLDSLIE